MIQLLEPPWFVYTPRGEGRALLFIDRGAEMNGELLVRLDATGDIFNVLSCEIRIIENPMFNDVEVRPFTERQV